MAEYTQDPQVPQENQEQKNPFMQDDSIEDNVLEQEIGDLLIALESAPDSDSARIILDKIEALGGHAKNQTEKIKNLVKSAESKRNDVASGTAKNEQEPAKGGGLDQPLQPVLTPFQEFEKELGINPNTDPNNQKEPEEECEECSELEVEPEEIELQIKSTSPAVIKAMNNLPDAQKKLSKEGPTKTDHSQSQIATENLHANKGGQQI